MDILIELTYAALVFAAFKIFKIPVNKWTVTTAVVSGFFVVGSIFLTMAYFHPYTPEGRIYFQTTPIVPQVRGKVLRVQALDNEQLKKGDILFEIDSTPYKASYDNAKAKVAEAKTQLAQVQKNIISAKADLKKFDAANQLAAVTEKRLRSLWEKRVISKQEYDQANANAIEAEEQLTKAKANLQKSLDAFETQQAVIQEAEADVDTAAFNLESTVVRAPANGSVTQVRLRAGMMAVPLPLKPVMTFITADASYIIGEFKQNPLQNIKIGNLAEVIFPALPGRAFRGRVTKIMNALGEGQLEPSGTLMRFEGDDKAGRVPVFITLDEDMSKYNLPLGSNVAVAVYSTEMEFLCPIRQILLRMVSWKNIVCFEAL
ncbi:HlyD family secretion protein [Halodesulfovibrio spirochaetisodalis]|uniref:Uncharacterized protein n=1 Tax=Halodesulfovibrio spirochaetisodalis TaxID=1560234 RepID=A0A1B7XC40_9BACT|nr:HlyD family secretion protein [Halodesulfovibrio spirochaetisodalis]OBQ51465.1 hypothetical protein SP90_09600 [Halodesulfovibrio spirochaetisodalis]